MPHSAYHEPKASGGLRVLTIIHSYESAGVERVALRLCESWQRSGADVTVLLGRKDGAMRAGAPKLNYVSYRCHSAWARHFETLWMIVSLLRWLRSNQPHVIFSPGNTYTFVLAVVRLLCGARCPPIVCKVSNSLARHDLPAPLRLGYHLWLRSHRRLAHWVAMSESLRPEIVQFFGVPSEKVPVVNDPALTEAEIDEHWSARQRAPLRGRRGRLIVSAGRLVRQKRFDLLIRAFCSGARAGDRLVILGDGPRRVSLQKSIRRLGATGRIRLLGHSRDVSAWLARADLLVLASDYEGLPAVLTEALASGVPIIATQCSPALDELTGHGKFGQILPCRNMRALASAIAGPPLSPVDKEHLHRMAQRFTLDIGAPAYLSIMGQVVEARAQASIDQLAPVSERMANQSFVT
jgi:glycosyltransferase involved in cell wall biosynthesis